jgi:hypothetical protein
MGLAGQPQRQDLAIDGAIETAQALLQLEFSP